ncbi:MAG: hypothetical protein U9O98_02525 [Asgard group archaeon]|nr:hypothetical protein [Asgard group archaeon]
MTSIPTVSPLKKYQTKRYVSLDFARGFAIVAMLFLHIVQRTLDIDGLFANINNIAIINLFALILIPFFGGLAGFFLIVSAAANMVSIYKNLKRGKSVWGIVLKQIVGGFLLLIFGMLCEGLIGYQGLIGNFARSLDNPLATEWTVMLWRWNFFETIHTIAWCLIINGIVQGLLSLKGNWKNTRKMIITYIILAIVVVALTRPMWDLVKLMVPEYPFGTFPNGHELYMPWIGYESFGEIIRAPFLNVLAAPMEPLFPYLAVSFIGSIMGIVLSKPREEVTKKFPQTVFAIGLVMFVCGLIGILLTLFHIMSVQNVDAAIEFYLIFPNHRGWSPDYSIADPSLTSIPPFAWLGQFLAVNGFSLILIIGLFRLIEFRGKSKNFAKKTIILRRFGTVAFTNYNNQWMYFVIFFLTSLLTKGTAYQKLSWAGTFLTILLTYLLYILILFLWEKVNYIGSLEWFIRTFANNVVPVRRDSFDPSVKWWQRGQVDVENTFYNPKWLTFETTESDEEGSDESIEDSKFALRFSLFSLCSILFLPLTIIALFVVLDSRKNEGKNKKNTSALVLSIIGIAILVLGLIISFIFPIGVLGIF